jgi:cytochrome c-type biogenesis protein CcmH
MLAAPARAVEPGEVLPDPALEARARAISANLRCLVCQNQSIDDSNAPLAKDLRLLVRERLTAGESDTAVVSYVVARYGDFVLLRPPVNARTALLWLAPLLCLAGLAYALRRMMGSGRAAPAIAPLSADEEKRLTDVLR